MKKKVLIVICLLVSLLFINNVSAKIVSIDDVSSRLNELGKNKDVTEYNIEIGSKVDSDNNKLIISFEGKEALSFDYTDEYISYTNPDTEEITEENVSEKMFNDLPAMISAALIYEVIYELGGYIDLDEVENMNETELSNLDETAFTEANYDKYGMYIKSTPYDFSGESWHFSGEKIEYIKISLDTDNYKGLEETIKDIKASTPTIKAKEVTSNSVVIYPHIDSESDTSCIVYRSEEKNGEYKKISDVEVNCSGNASITDENLEPGKTYYYKTSLVNGSIYSNVITVTTLGTKDSTSSQTTSTTNTTENPKTGIEETLSKTLIIITLSITSLYIINRSIVFRKL